MNFGVYSKLRIFTYLYTKKIKTKISFDCTIFL